ncbi:hypothetical protein [Nitrosomonas cryotolerans]|uniref:hypothetical protein n=1 Tax=Nitrosomonas cryotolerans TaxID=44575 RepID=UPI001160A25E|nr:hypothetical protein [Nitrosomonas cryotolerans]
MSSTEVASAPAWAVPAVDIADRAILVASANVFSFIIFLRYKNKDIPYLSCRTSHSTLRG